MIEITSTVKSYGGDTFLCRTFSDELAHQCSHLRGGLALDSLSKRLVGRAGRYEGESLGIVDYLNVYLLVASEYGHPGSLGSSVYDLADAVAYSLSSLYFSHCHIPILLLFSSG